MGEEHPAETAPAAHPSWSNVPDGALVGVVTLAKPMSDIRGVPMKPGVYTLRFALQPRTVTTWASPRIASFCWSPPRLTTRALTLPGSMARCALAKKTHGRTHPAALGLDPPTSDSPRAPVVTNEAGPQRVDFSVPVTLQGNPAGSLTFGVTIIGQYEH